MSGSEPNAASDLIARASSDYLADRYTEALLLLDEAIRIDPRSDEAWFLKAETLRMTGSY